jgi:IclR family KDG regulon transcriptional repressor
MREIQSLARGLKILNLLGKSQEGLSVTELSQILDIDKSSASRLASTLSKYDYVQKNPLSGRYHLGARILSLSHSLLTNQPFQKRARSFLHELMENSGECSHLAVPAHDKALCIDQVESPATLRVNVEMGQTLPLHCTALGKVLLAFSDLDLPQQLERYTPNTILNLDELEQHLEKIRQQGYAVDDEEYDLGVRCLAAPVYDFKGELVGSIGISGPAMRMTKEKLPTLIALVMAAGKELSGGMSLHH